MKSIGTPFCKKTTQYATTASFFGTNSRIRYPYEVVLFPVQNFEKIINVFKTKLIVIAQDPLVVVIAILIGTQDIGIAADVELMGNDVQFWQVPLPPFANLESTVR
jgi:hypothetical protein